MGGLCSVYEAEEWSSGRMVAIKSLNETIRADLEWQERFSNEIDLMTLVGSHPNIAKMLRSSTTNELAGEHMFYVMEFAPGRTLAELLSDGPLSCERAMVVLGPIFDALMYIHDWGIVHRDVKPGNIFIDSNGVSKLIDFGIAILVDGGKASGNDTEVLVGTPQYMSPE
jgi:eukaryotic-like serine/threonine-protein kinase